MEASNGRTFRYSYSSTQQEEVRKIQERYRPHEKDRMEQLRQLDRRVRRRGMLISTVLGIASSLLLGSGMACSMSWSENLFLTGLVLGAVGATGLCLTHPLYERITKKEQEKYAPQILALTEELLQN